MTFRLLLAPSATLVEAVRMSFLGGGDESEATATSCVFQRSGGRIAFRNCLRGTTGQATSPHWHACSGPSAGLDGGLRNELQKLGYVEGTNISIELRDAAGQNERLATLAEELLRLRVEVIVAVNTPAVQACPLHRLGALLT